MKSKFNLLAGMNGYNSHSLTEDELMFFSKCINSKLGEDPEVQYLLPLKEDGSDLQAKNQDGVLLW
jgi:hypothetical protein